MGTEPAGVLTFLFSDIEQSTKRWQDQPLEMSSALERHDAILTDAVAAHGGRVFKHTGDGVCAAFGSVADAVAAAVAAQRRLHDHDWAGIGELRVRMGMHTGEADQRDGDYFGPVLNRTARIMGVAHGGQILVSATTAGLLADSPVGGVELTDLGQHRLRDLVNVERLHQVVAAGLPAEFPPVRSLEAFDHNLPVQRTSFVGRADDLAAVLERLRSAPLVTLTGIGGAGKTRLALEAAAAALDRYPGGVFFVDLAPVADGDLVVPAVVAAVGLQRGGAAGGAAGSPLDELVDFLSRRRLLLVLDNCEHLVEDCAEVIDEILARSADTTVLATSREPLAVEGEHVVRVASLPVDEAGGEAVRLFDERAAAVDRAYDPGAHRSAVIDICRRLDGIPLAIELAAAQVSHLSPEEIAGRLDDRFRLLTGGRRRVQRQQTLEAALDWSHELLTDDERRLLRRLAVFAGGFGLADAEAVAAGDDLPPARILPLVGGLVEKSLLVASEHGGATRYRLLETVRLYGLQRLDHAGEVADTRDRHLARLLEVVEATPLGLRFEDVQLANGLWLEIENLRAALEWSVSQERLDLTARLVAGSLGLWWIHGLGEEGKRWSELALTASGLDPDLEAAVALVAGISTMMLGDLLAVETAFRRAVDRAVGQETRLMAQCWWGFVNMPDRPRAEEILCEALQWCEANGELAPVSGLPHFFLGAITLFHRDYQAALDHLDRARAQAPPESSFIEAFRRLWSAAALYLAGRHADAEARLDTAAGSLGQAWAAYSRSWTASVIAAGSGDRDAAIRLLADSVAVVRRHGVPLADRDCLLTAAAIAWHDGDVEGTARLLGSVRANEDLLRLRSPASYALYGHYHELVRGHLGRDERHQLEAAGGGVPIGEALDAELARLGAVAGGATGTVGDSRASSVG